MWYFAKDTNYTTKAYLSNSSTMLINQVEITFTLYYRVYAQSFDNEKHDYIRE